ncbi:MAG TPA: hypothetical protein VFA33_06015 [Bryobacteraceae bacterium]|nr:hypothetical protein [Bryobacteraceae bacterium]
MSKQVQTIRMIEQYGNLKVGLIPLDFANAVIIAANVVQNTTEGGRPDGNTAPILQRINSATDKALRLTWAAGSQVELQFPAVALPPDLDDAAPMEVHLICAKDANANTVNIDVQAFFGVGDTECGAATPTIAQARAEYVVTLAAADVPAAPEVLNLALVPGAHAGDALYLDAAWIEYARKA